MLRGNCVQCYRRDGLVALLYHNGTLMGFAVQIAAVYVYANVA